MLGLVSLGANKKKHSDLNKYVILPQRLLQVGRPPLYLKTVAVQLTPPIGTKAEMLLELQPHWSASDSRAIPGLCSLAILGLRA